MGYNKERYRTFKNICYYILFGIWWLVSHLPMWVLHGIADVLYFLMYYVVKYRHKVVYDNIRQSYPDFTEEQIKDTERRFYLHFCDIMVESLKYFSISKREMRKRMKFTGIELLEESCRNGKSCALFLGHYANWEWISSIPLWFNNELGVCSQLYHPLENLVTDRLICYTRDRFGGVNIPVDQSVRHIVNIIKTGKPILVGFIADQSPVWSNIHYWTNFLNHEETPIFTGAERIIRKFDMDVYYLDVKRVGRSRYECEMKRMTTTPNDYPEYGITEQYTRLLEESINRAPAYWLWSHRRWKISKKDWEQKMAQRNHS